MLKKILLFVLLFFTFSINYVNAQDNTLTVYVFTKDDCTSCDKTITFFEDLLKEDEYSFNLVEFRVWNENWITYSEELYNLIDEVYTYFGYELTSVGSVPTIIIGDFFYNGYPTDTTVLSDAVDDYIDIDVVEEIASTLEIDINELIYERDEDDESSYTDIIIFWGILIFVIVSGSILAYISKK